MSMPRPHVSLLSLAVLLAGGLAGGVENARVWTVVGQIGGPTQGIALQGSLAYTCVGMRLFVLDASDPSDLREIGATPAFPFFAEDVAVSGTLAFVAAGSGGLRVVDVSNPALPTEIGAWDTRAHARGVAVDGSIAYVANGPYGLSVVDVSTPSKPAELGSAYPMNYAFDVAVQGHYAYLAAAGAGLLVADVSDPRHPVEVGALLTDGYAWGVAVEGSTVWVADGWEGLQAVDLSDPSHPTRLGTYKTPGWAYGVTVSGTTVYVADSFRGLRVIDVADPRQPREVAAFEAPGGHAGAVAVAAGTAFVADRNWGVRAIALSAGPELAQTGSYHPIGDANGVAVSGTNAYVADMNGGLFVVDISDPTHPRQTGSVGLEGSGLDVAVRGTMAYVTTKGSGVGADLHTIDVADSTRPSRLGLFPFVYGGQPRGLDVTGQTVWVAAENHLEILDVSDPVHPTRISFFETKVHESESATAVGVVVAGTTAYVAVARGGLIVLDVSTPASPVLLGTFDPGSSFLVQDVAVSGNRAFLADTNLGLRVLDVSDPTHPVATGSLETRGPESVILAGSVAYLSARDYGMLAVDVSDPDHPALTGHYRTAGYTRKIAIADGREFLADGQGGLLILQEAAGTSSTVDEARHPEHFDGLPSGVPDPFPLPSRRPPAAIHENVGSPAMGSRAASSLVVTSTADSGSGTLRQCLLDAGNGTTITFDPAVFPPGSPASIRPTSDLPGIPANVVIDGSDSGVILDGSGIPSSPGHVTSHGLSVSNNGCTIRGLQIVGFSGNGIQVHGSSNVIGGDRAVGRGPSGQGNVVSGNQGAGIMITGDDGGSATQNIVAGNFIGTRADGVTAMGNGTSGVWVQNARDNQIGGSDPADRNVVCANRSFGILVSGKSTENLVEGNYVGTDIGGSVALGNVLAGVMISTGAFGNVFRANVVSGNLGSGVGVDDLGSSYNSIVGNLIGTDAAGSSALPNGEAGVWLNPPGGFNRIGGVRPEDRNIISGNLAGGIDILTSGNIVLGNFVGTDVSGRKPLGNAGSGIGLAFGGNIVGGATSREANVIAANGWVGVAASVYTDVIGNTIGTDPSGTLALGNRVSGVSVEGRHSVVQGNVLAYAIPYGYDRPGYGVVFLPESDCTIRRNSIYGNAEAGIQPGFEPAEPVISSATPTLVTGTACAGCEVEVFSDSEEQGRVFEGSVIADASGTFTFTRPYGRLSGPNATATATDDVGRTSAFSEPKPVLLEAPRHPLARVTPH